MSCIKDRGGSKENCRLRRFHRKNSKRNASKNTSPTGFNIRGRKRICFSEATEVKAVHLNGIGMKIRALKSTLSFKNPSKGSFKIMFIAQFEV